MHIFLIIALFVFLACIWEDPFAKIQRQLDELKKTPEQRELERICAANKPAKQPWKPSRMLLAWIAWFVFITIFSALAHLFT